jgi:uncharacterized RDD family membrane protein YckC
MTYKRQPLPTPVGGRLHGFLQRIKDHALILLFVLLILALAGWILFILSYFGYINKQ